ncbi:MAG: uncharacterized protein QOE90_2101 [Thermoplasmata archaeon]|jgi:endonuclease V-like protein UPF0215 family|nr:uncharacterized protein [Thermoplasmata archaeon]
MTMKSEIRTIGFDDSPHTRADGRVPVVGVHMRGATRVEGILATDVMRDGGDATARVAQCVLASGLRGTKALLLDGASFAGFNVVDLEGLAAETRIPCIAFTKGVPDYASIEKALRHVPDAEAKWRLIERRRTATLPTATSPITISWAGDVDPQQAVEILARTTAGSLVPEPLRVAHLVASVML